MSTSASCTRNSMADWRTPFSSATTSLLRRDCASGTEITRPRPICTHGRALPGLSRQSIPFERRVPGHDERMPLKVYNPRDSLSGSLLLTVFGHAGPVLIDFHVAPEV